jgi:hypothetical protein
MVLKAALQDDDLPREMDVLTCAFVEARYSRHPVQPGLVHRVQASWQRVKQALASMRKTPAARRRR